MSKFNKFSSIIYDIKGTETFLMVHEHFKERPGIFIDRQFSTEASSEFWKFVLDVVEEADQAYLDLIKNEDGDARPEEIIKAKQYAEKFGQIKEALTALTQAGNKA